MTGALYDMLNKSTGNITEMTQSLESNANKSKSSYNDHWTIRFCSEHLHLVLILFFSLLVSELESFRIGLESKVVDKDIEHSDMLQKMSTVEQEIFVRAVCVLSDLVFYQIKRSC